ncbi:MAG: GIN domain-containing protein [Odoribacter splanchnicus]
MKNLALATSGASNASVNVTETLEVEASGAAHVSYSGNPKVTSHVSGAASLKQR